MDNDEKTSKLMDWTQLMAWDKLQEDIHQNAVEHGWWEEERSLPEILALIHSEVSEVLEEYRNGHRPTETYYSEGGKPEGIPSELADIIIRVLDYAGYAHIDMWSAMRDKMTYNRTRPYRHGGKIC